MRVILSWLVSLFRCPGCTELRSERDYLRGILSSTRTLTRDVAQAPDGLIVTTPGIPIDNVNREDKEPERPLSFGRDAVQDLILAND